MSTKSWINLHSGSLNGLVANEFEPKGDDCDGSTVNKKKGDTGHNNRIGKRKMRQSRPRKKTIGSWIASQGRQGEGAWSVEASPRPAYESFRIPTPRGGAPSKAATPASATMKKGDRVTGHIRMMAACNDAENIVQNPSSTLATLLLQHVNSLAQSPFRGRDDGGGGAANQAAALSPISVNALEGGAIAARPLQQQHTSNPPGTGVKHMVVKLSSLKTPTGNPRELIDVVKNSEEPPPVKETVVEESRHAGAHKGVWSNAAFCPEISRDEQSNNSIDPKSNFPIPPQNLSTTAQVRFMPQTHQIYGERGAQHYYVEAHKDDRPAGLAVCGESSGNCTLGGLLAPIDESCCVLLEPNNGHVRNCASAAAAAGSTSFFSQLLLSPKSTSSAAVASRSYPATACVSSPAVSGCSACARFNASCHFHMPGGGSRAVRYYHVEPAPKSCGGNSVDPLVCLHQDMDPEEARLLGTSPIGIELDAEISHLRSSQSGTLVRTADRHIPDIQFPPVDDISVPPGPKVHKGTSNFDTPATSVVNQPHAPDSMGLTWATASHGDVQSRCKAKEDKNDQQGMPEPVFPPALRGKLLNNNYYPNVEAADMESEMQRQLEEEIAREISMLSQKLENLQARYGARRAVQNKPAKLAVLSCPQTPLLLDNPRLSHCTGDRLQQHATTSNSHSSTISETTNQTRVGRVAVSSKYIHPRSKTVVHDYQRATPRLPLEDRHPNKFGSRHTNCGTNNNQLGPSSSSSTSSAHCSKKGISDPGSATALKASSSKKHPPHCRGVSDTCRLPATCSTTGVGTSSRVAQGFPQHRGNDVTGTAQVADESGEAERLSNKGWNSATSFRKVGQKQELGGDDFYSDDLKEQPGTGGSSGQLYPDNNKRFDWVKTLRFGGMGVHTSLVGSDASDSIMPSKSWDSEKDLVTVAGGPSNKSWSDIYERDAETWLRDSGCHADAAQDGEVLPVRPRTSVSKSVQAGGAASPELRKMRICVDGIARTLANTSGRDGNQEIESNRPKRRPDTSLEHRPGKSGKKCAHVSDMGVLDSRMTFHLLKAGLKRAPSFMRTPAAVAAAPRLVPTNLRSNSKPFGALRNPIKEGGKCLQKKNCAGSSQKGSVQAKNPEPEGKSGDDVTQIEGRHLLGLKELGKREEAIEAVSAEWLQEEGGHYDAEYETFVETTDVGGLSENVEESEGCHSISARSREAGLAMSAASHSEEDDLSTKQSPSSISTQEKARLSEAAVVSLTKAPQSTKKTSIRCIELVVAIRNKDVITKATRRKTSGIWHSTPCERIDRKDATFCKMDYGKKHVKEGHHTCPNTTTELAGQQKVVKKPKASPDGGGCKLLSKEAVLQQRLPASMKGLKEIGGAARGPDEWVDTQLTGINLGKEDRLPQATMQGEEQCCHIATIDPRKSAPTMTPSTGTRAEENDCDDDASAPLTATKCVCPAKDQASNLATILSRVMPKARESLEAEQLKALYVRARWEELIDALETERLGLPKIKTICGGGEHDGVAKSNSSPRDSGCVKRIAEQAKRLRALNLRDEVARAAHAAALQVERETSSSTVQQEPEAAQIDDHANVVQKGRHWWKIQQKQAVVF